MENLNEDLTVNGKCDVSKCKSKCCSSVILLTDRDIKKIHKYIERNNIESNHKTGDVCPFLNEEYKCNIHIHAPQLCKEFMCNKSIGWRSEYKDKHLVDMWEEFYPEEGHVCPVNIGLLNYELEINKNKLGL